MNQRVVAQEQIIVLDSLLPRPQPNCSVHPTDPCFLSSIAIQCIDILIFTAYVLYRKSWEFYQCYFYSIYIYLGYI